MPKIKHIFHVSETGWVGSSGFRPQ